MHIDGYCEYPFNRCRITCEGWVAMCCFMRPDPLQPTRQAYIGNLLEQNFDEIWFGEAAERIRQDVIEGKLNEKCKCPGCPYLGMSQPYPKKNIGYNEYPSFLEIDLPNTHCNIGGIRPDPIKSPACIMCERNAPFFTPEEDRLFEVLPRIKHIISNLTQIHVQGIAEPFYETNRFNYMLFGLLDALDFDQYADRITISVTTNGILMKKAVRDEYLSRIPHSITNFSLDAATQETYKKIRILDCFDKVLENLYAFSAQRVRPRQFLRIHNNINTLNVHEVKEMVHIAHRAKVEYIEFNPTDGFNHRILVNQNNCEQFAEAQRIILNECRKLKVPYKFLRPLDMGLTKLVQIGGVL